ncbi:sorting nexin-14-like [Ornithodoros turicata]
MSYVLIVCHDKILSSTIAVVLAIATVCVLSFGILSGITVIGSFICGGIWMQLFRLANFEIPNLWCSRTTKQTAAKNRCSRCEKIGCQVHDYILFPWKDLKIPQEVDIALEDLLERVLKEYVYAWYREVSCDEAFVHELRLVLRHLLSSLYRRMARIDLVQLITGKVTQVGLEHLDCYVKSKRVAPVSANLERFVLSCLGSDLHVALSSRDAELEYLRHLTELLLMHLVPARYRKCKSARTLIREVLSGTVLLKAMDIVADPDIINHVLLLFFDKTPMEIFPLDQYEPVEFLDHFVVSNAPASALVQPMDLKTLLKNEKLKNAFEDFLRDEAAEHLLGFYHALDDFSDRILNPELTSAQLKALHDEAESIYMQYMGDSALTRVPIQSTERIREVLDLPAEEIITLQKTTPLFEAFEDLYGIFEKIILPLFFQSDRYFETMCQTRSQKECQKKTDKAFGKGGDSSAVAKLSHKIRGALWVNTDDGFEEDTVELAQPALRAEGYCMDDDPRLKDLSAWRVSIPTVETRVDMSHKHYSVYIIQVQRIDVTDTDTLEDLKWCVTRKYEEFYILEVKLVEFHGALPVDPLPPRRSANRRQHTQTYRAAFEKYLQDLLAVPLLRGSELLYRFLKSDDEFTTGFLPDIKLGRMFRTVPMKLVKEKGQHLEPFLQAFLASTEQARPKPLAEWIESSEPRSKARRQDSIYGNGTGNALLRTMLVNSKVQGPQSAYDCVIYLAESIFSALPWTMRLLRSVAPFLRHTLQGAVERFLAVKLEQALAPKRIAMLLTMLKEAIFEDGHNLRTDDEKRARAQETRKELLEFLPTMLVRLIGKSKHDQGIMIIMDALQHPLLNKHLSYVLLDVLVKELFPELNE